MKYLPFFNYNSVWYGANKQMCQFLQLFILNILFNKKKIILFFNHKKIVFSALRKNSVLSKIMRSIILEELYVFQILSSYMPTIYLDFY